MSHLRMISSLFSSSYRRKPHLCRRTREDKRTKGQKETLLTAGATEKRHSTVYPRLYGVCVCSRQSNRLGTITTIQCSPFVDWIWAGSLTCFTRDVYSSSSSRGSNTVHECLSVIRHFRTAWWMDSSSIRTYFMLCLELIVKDTHRVRSNGDENDMKRATGRKKGATLNYEELMGREKLKGQAAASTGTRNEHKAPPPIFSTKGAAQSGYRSIPPAKLAETPRSIP